MIVETLNVEATNFELDDNRFALVGLGNISERYENTRHNAGFMFIDKILDYENIDEARENKDFFGDFQRFSKYGLKFFALKPSTFMNESGRAARALIKYYDLLSSNLILIHDDLDIEFGKYKIQFGKGPRVHNGVTSVENTLGTNEFWHVRIGIEARTPEIRAKFESKEYVLSRFDKSEKEALDSLFIDIWEDLQNKVKNGVQA